MFNLKFRDYYQTLELEHSATADEVKRSYRKLARKYHPDVSREPNAENRFKEITEAYEVLKDPEKRASYDQLGAKAHAGQDFRPPPGWQGNFNSGPFGSSTGFSESSPFSDFFESLFGHQTQRPNHTNNHYVKLEIDIDDSYNGTTRLVTLNDMQTDSQGHRSSRPRELKIKIPKGILPGQQIKLRGQGGQIQNGSRGDLYLENELPRAKAFRLSSNSLREEGYLNYFKVKHLTPQAAGN